MNRINVIINQNSIESPFTGFRAYTPSTERDPRNNISDNCWLKAIPQKQKTSSTSSNGREMCNYCYQSRRQTGNFSTQPGSLHPSALCNAASRYQIAPYMAMPKPRPHKLSPSHIERTLEQWELESTIPDPVPCGDDGDDDRGSSSGCLFGLLRERISWVLRNPI